MSNDLVVKHISELTDTQFKALGKLTVSKHQEVLGKSFRESIEDWELAPKDQVMGLCFILDNQPIGITLFKKISANTASIHGLKIATPWQGKGFGHRAFRLAIDELKMNWIDISLLKLAVDAENTAAIRVYRAFGMKDSGPIFEGPNGQEHRMALEI